MQGCIPRFNLCRTFAAWIILCLSAGAADVPPTWIDDAQLHDVQFVGSKFAIAVGEHGAIWKSIDGGQSWIRMPCELDVSLRSVCFLDDRVGWIAGGNIMPYSGSDGGVLLATRDAGKSWQRIGEGTLSPLSYVKFFSLEEGVVVGQPTTVSPSGIFKTDDGLNWHGVRGDSPQPWKAASFIEPQLGAVAGVGGKVALMGGDQLFASKLQARGFRSIRAISLSSNESGWLAGDGGLLLKSVTNGVVWEAPATELPDEVREGMDFRAIEVRGDKVWLAGSPGSVIWHSPNGGQSWVKQSTGQAVPLSAIRFTNDMLGLAVGAFGEILRTDDGGRKWRAVRGEGRRAAMLSLHARPGQTSAPLLTRLSGESGYRSAVWIAQRNDLGPLATASDGEARLQAAVQRCGAHSADVHWQLPVTVPGLEYSSEKLLAEWQRQTEGRLPQTLLGGLVRQIRTWRPNVVVIDQPSPDDAASQLLFDATLRAVEQAGDPTRNLEQTESLGLAAWKIDRIYMRLAGGSTGDLHIELDEFLPNLKSSTRVASSFSTALLQSGKTPQRDAVESQKIAYRWVGLDGKPADELANGRGSPRPPTRSRDFFAGLSIAPGSDARRESIAIDEANMIRMEKLVEKQRNFTAIAQKSLDDPRIAGQMLSQINGIVEGMPAAQATVVLRDLADEYRKRSQFEMVEATYVELARRYPKEPATVDAMRWLIQFWSSSETAWQRTRTVSSESSVSRTAIDLQARYVDPTTSGAGHDDEGVRQAAGSGSRPEIVQGNSASPVRFATNLEFDEGPSRIKNKSKSGRLKMTPDAPDWRTGAVAEWHTRALELSRQLGTVSPGLFKSAEIQFPLAALRRSKGMPRAADEILRNVMSSAIDAETKELAQRELWASMTTPDAPHAIALCKQAEQRPNLDGLLSDRCWEVASEVPLSTKPTASQTVDRSGEPGRSIVMFAYDSEFLFLAFSVPRAAGTSRDQPQLRNRQHDADLSGHDRICIRLDIDRDYMTWYEFQVDQRGWTAESCWEDRRWNPTWFVAAEADETDWRIEAAIPWKELTSTPPTQGTLLGLSVLRTTPGVGLQSWTHPATTRPQPSSFGFLKFE